VTIDVDHLPPTQYLILEVLAARVRTGEQVWSFPDRLRPQLRALEQAGLIGWKSSPAPGACWAWFTDAGRGLFVVAGFETPHTRELLAAQRTASEAVERQLALVQENQRLRAEVQANGVELERMRLKGPADPPTKTSRRLARRANPDVGPPRPGTTPL
jgi:hypothetical protein